MIVTLYSKPGCHLCDDVRSLLDELASESGFSVEEVNIESQPALFETYRHEIPVVLMDGQEIARGKIDERALTAALVASS